MRASNRRNQRMKRLIPILSVLLLLGTNVFAQPRATSEAKTPTIAEKVAPMQKFPGYFPFYWDAKAGKIWLEIDKWNSEFLYVESLPAGIGSNDIGLDRGQLGQSHIVRFERTGPRVLLIASNDARSKMHLPNRRCGDLKLRRKKAIARWLTRLLSICATCMEFLVRCNAT